MDCSNGLSLCENFAEKLRKLARTINTRKTENLFYAISHLCKIISAFREEYTDTTDEIHAIAHITG